MENKYKSLGEFRKDYLSEYRQLHHKGLLFKLCEDMGWDPPRNFNPKWTKELCHVEALKYSVKEHWKKGHNLSYSNARRNGWYDECTTHMVEGCKPRNYWTKERCIEESLKYSVKEHWKKQHPPSYQASQRNGWYNELTTHMIESTKPKGYWTKERCIENAKNFTTISDWSNSNSTPVTNARANGWYDECTAHMFRVNKPANYWNNKERCMEEALKFTVIGDWSNGSSASYSQARKNGWYEECTAHMVKLKVRLNTWTKESCMEKALKYKTITQWQKGDNSSLKAAKINNWFEECTAHMIVKKRPKGYWTKERCLEEALKYETIKEWNDNNTSSQSVARKSSWYNECTKHMKKYAK